MVTVKQKKTVVFVIFDKSYNDYVPLSFGSGLILTGSGSNLSGQPGSGSNLSGQTGYVSYLSGQTGSGSILSGQTGFV